MLTKTECDAARIFELETQNDRLRADNARLTAELEAARKVAGSLERERDNAWNAAVEKCASLVELPSFISLTDLAECIRRLALPPLSATKQAAIANALSNLDAKAGAAVGVYRMGEDIEC